MRGESARPGKRPLRALSASEKMDAIQRVHEGESKASVARDIGVPESTLRGWCKSEHKIRGMARNSSTPDSEAHSPASSSGAANNTGNTAAAAAAVAAAAAAAAINNVSAAAVASANSINNSSSATNLSSEDEGGPCAKKMKLDSTVAMITPQQHSPPTPIVTPATTSVSFGTVSTSSINDNHLLTDTDSSNMAKQQDTKPKIDYVSLMASMANMRPENSSLLLQQLGLLSGATAGSLAQSLLSMTQSSLAATASATTTQHGGGSAVGLVENGLQYTKSNVMLPNGTTTGTINGSNMNVGGSGSGKRHSISAIAPTQMDSVVAKSCSTRKSLPPAAEAPSTPVPASPRKTNDNNNMQRTNTIGGGVGTTNKAKKENSNIVSPNSATSGTTTTTTTASSGNRKVDEALWLWLTQQQKLLTQQSTSFMPSINQQDGSWFWQWYKQCSFPLTAPTPVATPTSVAKKSPSKAKALLDNVLCNNNNNNNNENIVNKRVLSMDAETTEDDNGVPSSTEEAIEHGEKFFKWLDRCSEPAVTRLQIMQFKYLLDNLKSCRKKTSSLKQSRK